MISGKNRFHGHGSLRYVYSKGSAVRSPALTIKYVKNDRRKNSRAAVVVSKKVLKSAIGRNRIRRRLYEYIRLSFPNLSNTYDFVFIVTSPDLQTMPHNELTQLIDQLMDKAHLLKRPNN